MDHIIQINTKYDNIYGLPLFVREYERLYKKNPRDQRAYSRWLNKRLAYLNEYGDDVFRLFPEPFEPAEGTPVPLGIIRKRGFVGNPRIIFFSCVEYGEKPVYILLHAFKERNGADYANALPVALKRRKEIITMIEEESI